MISEQDGYEHKDGAGPKVTGVNDDHAWMRPRWIPAKSPKPRSTVTIMRRSAAAAAASWDVLVGFEPHDMGKGKTSSRVSSAA
jgi:hypothetical protein